VSLALSLCYAMLLLIVVCALLWSAWPRWMKSLLVLASTALYFGGYQAVSEIWGIPSSDPLPSRFLMLAAAIEEPSAKSKGALYFWVSKLQDGKPTIEPRAYRLPYTKLLHSQVAEGLRRGRDGVAQMGTAETKSSEGTGGFFGLKPGNDEQIVNIRDLPSPQLPEK
jgi:hypothetical protein